jgi:hypothetical protein
MKLWSRGGGGPGRHSNTLEEGLTRGRRQSAESPPEAKPATFITGTDKCNDTSYLMCDKYVFPRSRKEVVLACECRPSEMSLWLTSCYFIGVQHSRPTTSTSYEGGQQPLVL